MDKMKMQDVQLTQASGDTMSSVNDQRSVTGTTPPQPLAQIAKAQPVKGQKDHLGRGYKSTELELFTPTAMHKPTSTCTIGSSLIHVH